MKRNFLNRTYPLDARSNWLVAALVVGAIVFGVLFLMQPTAASDRINAGMQGASK